MGNQWTNQFEVDFKEGYNFIQLLEDPNYGLVKIYRKKQINYDYVMVYEESLQGQSQEQISEQLRQLERLKTFPHDKVLRLYHFEIVRGTPSHRLRQGHQLWSTIPATLRRILQLYPEEPDRSQYSQQYAPRHAGGFIYR